MYSWFNLLCLCLRGDSVNRVSCLCVGLSSVSDSATSPTSIWEENISTCWPKAVLCVTCRCEQWWNGCKDKYLQVFWNKYLRRVWWCNQSSVQQLVGYLYCSTQYFFQLPYFVVVLEGETLQLILTNRYHHETSIQRRLLTFTQLPLHHRFSDI